MIRLTSVNNLCVIVLFATSTLRAEPPKDETFGLKNGRYWNSMPTDCRGWFLVGLLDGWKLRSNTEELVMGKVVNAFGGKIMASELADMISSFYAETENMGLPIGWTV